METLKAFLSAFNLSDFVGSKKAKMTMATILGAFTALLGIDWPESVRVWISGFLVALIGAVVVVYLFVQGKVDVTEVLKAAEVVRDAAARNPDVEADAARDPAAGAPSDATAS